MQISGVSRTGSRRASCKLSTSQGLRRSWSTRDIPADVSGSQDLIFTHKMKPPTVQPCRFAAAMPLLFAEWDEMSRPAVASFRIVQQKRNAKTHNNTARKTDHARSPERKGERLAASDFRWSRRPGPAVIHAESSANQGHRTKHTYNIHMMIC